MQVGITFDDEKQFKKMTDMFSAIRSDREEIREGVLLLPGFCSSREILPVIRGIVEIAPFRHMLTPGGRPMSVAMTNCGSVGWISDRDGYRYSATDPESHRDWPAMPEIMFDMAQKAAEESGFEGFEPDSCLINRYDPKASLGAHQDKDEACFDWPIVSVSLGLSASFQLYGDTRGGPATNMRLDDGDILVFGGPARLAYHGVRKLLTEGPAHMNDHRINLTFRRALS